MKKELPFTIIEIQQDLTWGEIGMLLLLGTVYYSNELFLFFNDIGNYILLFANLI